MREGRVAANSPWRLEMAVGMDAAQWARGPWLATKTLSMLSSPEPITVLESSVLTPSLDSSFDLRTLDMEF